MSVLLTDSDCELWFDELEPLNIKNIEMPYILDGNEYMYDLGKTTDFKDFYNKLRKGVSSTTSALNIEQYKNFLTPIFESGEDVLYISFSHAMSGTFDQLRIAMKELKEKFPNRKLTLFNTNAISVPSGIQVKAAAKLKENGATDEEIISFLKEFTNNIACYFVVNNLMHLKRGGRLSATAAIAGSILNLKPILSFDSKGSLKVVNKIIGRKAALNYLTKKVIEDAIDEEKYDAYIIDADCRNETEEMAKKIKTSRPNLNVKLQTIGPVIGSHCGPDVVGVVFVAKNRVVELEKNISNVEVL